MEHSPYSPNRTGSSIKSIDSACATRASATGDTITTYHFQAEIAQFMQRRRASRDRLAKARRLYDDLYKLEPTPIVLLNRAIARRHGPHAGLSALEEIDAHSSLRNYHPLPAVAAELWKQAGTPKRAAEGTSAHSNAPSSAPERASSKTTPP